MYTPADLSWYIEARQREAQRLAENWRLFQDLKGRQVIANPGRLERWLASLRGLVRSINLIQKEDNITPRPGSRE